MIRAVFFDWFNTLACFDPPREELHSRVLHEFGIEVPPRKIFPGVLAADSYWFDENARLAVRKRSPEEREEVNIGYQQVLLAETGVNTSRETLLKISKRVRELFSGMAFALYDDVLPVLAALKERTLILGMITNLARDMTPICDKLGVASLLDFVVTSQEIGVDKPDPRIFMAALECAGVSAAEAVHVGDEYRFDVVGARGVGMASVMIDRYNLHAEVTDCPRINSLRQLGKYL
ncbi:HAD family hydrolase [Chloroflexota bacterium]